MATFRPVKKWLVPLTGVLLGLLIGFTLFPSQQEFEYKRWMKHLESLENGTYRIETKYTLDEASEVTTSRGYWSKERSTYRVSTPVTDGTAFTFDVYMEGDRFFVHSGDEWIQGEHSHPIWNELSPLDNPFQWGKDILPNADEIYKIEKSKEHVVYRAVFHHLNAFDFRGTSLQEQEGTDLTMELADGLLQSMTFTARPIRPDELSPFDRYPEHITYEISFSASADEIPSVPEEAYEAEELE